MCEVIILTLFFLLITRLILIALHLLIFVRVFDKMLLLLEMDYINFPQIVHNPYFSFFYNSLSL